MGARLVALVSLLLVGSPAFAQESKIVADFKREGKELAQSCGEFSFKTIAGCAHSLLTLHPVHVVLGSLAPTNGLAIGGAFTERFTPNESWRLSWNTDAAASPSGSWRAGAYMKMIHTPATSGVGLVQPGASATGGTIAPREFAVADVYVQSTSLKTVNFFGSGPASLESGRSLFGERQTVVGGTVIYPLIDVPAIGRLRPALIGGAVGRFINVHASDAGEAPAIEELYDATTAPGLGPRTRFLELREAIRFKPSVANDRVRFNYLISAQQFRANAPLSFNRWTLDLRHEIPLYRNVSSTGPRDFNGPDDCHQSAGTMGCAPISWSRNRQGAVGLRALVVTSSTSADNRVPFYLQPTIGGSDLNGERLLASFDDYRFRAPHLIALQGSIEHSIWGPFGVFAQIERGKVTSTRGDLGFKDLAGSTSVGVTLRAGGFPAMTLSFSWGSEGNHVIADMSSTLLGGSARPSLF